MLKIHHWFLAFITALSLHGLTAVWLTQSDKKQSVAGADDEGKGGISAGLGMAGDMRESIAMLKAQRKEAQDSAKVTPKKNLIKAAKEVQPKPEKVEQKPEIAVAKQTEVQEQNIEVPKPKPPKPEPEPEIVKEKTKPEELKDIDKTVNNSQDKASSVQRQKGTGRGISRHAGGQIGDSKSYFSQLFAWLLQHQIYPVEVKKQKIEGTALVQFSFNKQGFVIHKKIRKSSGNSLLDKEALDMLERAEPLPAIPEFLNREKLTLSFNAEFSLIKK